MYIRLGPSDTLDKTNCCIGQGLWGTSENAQNANFALTEFSEVRLVRNLRSSLTIHRQFIAAC
jgi:hypothetical protein